MEKNTRPKTGLFKMQVGAADISEGMLRRVLMVFFGMAGLLFLWTPTQWWLGAFQRFSAFQKELLPGLAAPGPETPSAPLSLPAQALLGQAPAAPETETPAKQPRPVVFRLLAPAAKAVHLGGSFNGFDARRHPLTRRPDGVWEITLDLSPGRYSYKFKVDGRWELDPTNPEKTPEPRTSSILEIQ